MHPSYTALFEDIMAQLTFQQPMRLPRPKDPKRGDYMVTPSMIAKERAADIPRLEAELAGAVTFS